MPIGSPRVISSTKLPETAVSAEETQDNIDRTQDYFMEKHYRVRETQGHDKRKRNAKSR